MKINGKWYFNEVVDGEEWINQNVTFISAGEEYERMLKLYSSKNKSEISYGEHRTAYTKGGWTNEAYRTIDFGAAYQEVSDEFYNWLTANAVQLSNPIPMTHPKGIKLLTKGHKLSKDLEVVPTFMETVDITINADTSSTGAFTVLEGGKISALYIDDMSNYGITGTTLKVIKNSIFYVSEYSETTLSDGEELGNGVYKATANATLTVTH